MTLTFMVRDPVGINAYYKRGAGRRLYASAAGKSFKARIAAGALYARSLLGTWTQDLDSVRRARVSYQLYNSRLDTDAPRKIIRDALEGVLYANDKIAEDGPAPLSIKDDLGKRVVITVELLEVAT